MDLGQWGTGEGSRDTAIQNLGSAELVTGDGNLQQMHRAQL